MYSNRLAINFMHSVILNGGGRNYDVSSDFISLKLLLRLFSKVCRAIP
jgi:hypothetical protein